MTTTLRANVRPDYGRTGVRIFLAHEDESGDLRVHTFAQTTTPINQFAAVPDHLGTVISDEMARALYGALAEHYGHTAADMRQLRKDYDAERGRVDRFITHLTGGAK